MDCPHCGIAFHDEWSQTTLGSLATDNWQHGNGPKAYKWNAFLTTCPACRNETINLQKQFPVGHGKDQWAIPTIYRVYPASTSRKPTPKEVPSQIKEDYEEAARVLPVSHKASAALSRRCLQATLRGQGYLQNDLARQIDALLNETDPKKAIPSSLRATVDAIRNFGNFSAHPITDHTTLQVIQVDAGEAEWCLDILDEMFDHFYVKPQQAAERKAALDAKLSAAGKPPSK